jgi:kumamolisin
MALVPLQGSHRRPFRNARAVRHADPQEWLRATVLVRRRDASGLTAHATRLANGERPARHLTHAEFDARYGATEADMGAVATFAARHGLAVETRHAGRRSMIIAGTVAQFNAAFGVDLQLFEYDGGTYRGRTGDIMLPQELHGIVQAVLGLDNRPVARPHFRRLAPLAAGVSFTPLQIAQLYSFPPGDGAGQTIALIELGGGYAAADLATYFAGIGVPPPRVIAVGVDGAANTPTGSANGPDGEVLLDIEVAGAIAPAATLVVYFAPNTDAGFLDAITTAVHDTTYKPSVLSISWGGPESSWTAQDTAAFDSAFQAAATLGITVLAASGDNGSSDGASGQNVDFPASSPHVTGCGGTSISATASTLAAETVWNDGTQGGAGGGGVSTVFAVPSWQTGLSATTSAGAHRLAMRGVPDIAGDADPQTGYLVRVDGQDIVIGGTSAVAPLWAGLIARINAGKTATAGLINPVLYANPAALHDITSGNNGTYDATPGWDACTGLGSPIGTALAQIL